MNVKKKIILEQLADYFMDKGKFLTAREYRQQTDAPVRHVLVPRLVGPWTRLKPLIARAFPEKYAIIEAGGILPGDPDTGVELTEEEKKAAAKAETLAKLKKGADDEADE